MIGALCILLGIGGETVINLIVSQIIKSIKEFWNRFKADQKIEEATNDFKEAKEEAEVSADDSAADYTDARKRYFEYLRTQHQVRPSVKELHEGGGESESDD